MKIAQVAPLFESVPPHLYGGTERVVSFLTEELVRQGHEVALFASGDSKTSARLISVRDRAIRLDSSCGDPLPFHALQLELVAQMSHEFDIIHFHTDYLHFPTSRSLALSHVTTLHGRLDIPDLLPLYDEFDEMPLVSISKSQRRPLPLANWVGNVYHGLPSQLLKFNERGGDYFAFLGRVSPEKGLVRAIEIALRAQVHLRIAAKIDPGQFEYFNRTIGPYLKNPLIEFIGEINDSQKSEFLGQAKALLFPIDWPEPFGLVMIESMACGTPVIAHSFGSVPEIIEEGVNGLIIRSDEAFEDSALAAVCEIGNLNRARCRQIFEERFSVESMAREYVRIYESIIREKKQFEPSSKRRLQVDHPRRPDLHSCEFLACGTSGARSQTR